MSRGLPTLAFVVVVSTLVAPTGRRHAVAVPEPRNDKPGEAMAFRALSLRDERGGIAADGLMRARRHVRAMRGARERAEGRTPVRKAPPQGSVATEGTVDTSGEPIQASVPLSNSGWTWIGPGNVGGRVRALVVHPAAPATMFAGSVGGGIWKTTNGGASWAPVDDFMANLAVTSIVFQPGNPQTMFASTGEGFNNADAIRGAGIFKSTDGGSTWAQLPSTATSSFYYVLRLAVSRNGGVLLAGTLSGLFRSVDAGATWARIAGVPALYDVDFHPTDSARAVAGDRSGRAWYTTNGGITWTQATLVLPASSEGSRRVEVAYAKGAPDVVYAVVDRNGGIVYRSIDGGVTFTDVFHRGSVELLENRQGWYDLALWVNPADSQDLLVGGVNLYRSRDGGLTFFPVSSTWSLHADQHIIVDHPQYDGATNRVLFIGNDGGVYKVPDLALLTSINAATYEELNNNLGVTQFYGAAGNPASGVIVGGTQDNGTLMFDPRTGRESWHSMFGGDGGFSAADSSDPNYFYGEYVYLQIHRSTDGGRNSQYIYAGLEDAGRYANFIAPFVLDPHDPRRLLAGGLSLWRSNDVKASWPAWENIKPADIGSPYISAIAVSPASPEVIWVAHNNGDLYRTLNGTASAPTWTKMDPSGFPNRFVTRITIDPFDPNVVYVMFGGFADQNIQRTENGGTTWMDATGTGDTGLPLAPVRDVEVDPTDSNVLWAGTEVGIFTSGDRGQTWDPTQDGPANVSVDELFVMGEWLIAVTHGRGLFRHRLADATGTPEVAFSPDPLLFHGAYVGQTTETRTLDVVNAGTAPLTIASVAIAGAHAGDFALGADACSGATVDPAAWCAVSVTATPAAAGWRTATLAVWSNAPGSPHTATLEAHADMPPGALPAPWLSRDIGNVGVAGSAEDRDGTFTVNGGGADVWGTIDAFQYAYQPLEADGQITARVVSVQNLASWVKAGVMIRQSLEPNAAHGFVLVSAAKGLAFQRRVTAGGVTTHTSGGAGTAPAWVRLTRIGQRLVAYRSADGVLWTKIGEDTISFSGPAYVGLAVNGQSTTRTATATFDSVTVSKAPAMPEGWSARDIGAVGTPGGTSWTGGAFTLKGAGVDVWGTADSFHFAYRTLAGDGSIVARVATLEGTKAWTKIGVMMRGSASANAAHAFMLVSKSKGLAFQRRAKDGGLSTHTSGGAGTAPRWVKLARTGQVITASLSSDGATWVVVGSDTIALPATALVGLVAHSNDPSVLATATFDNMTVTSAPSLPEGWNGLDIGAVGVPGSASASDGTFVVKGAGADVWGTADGLHYAFTAPSGDVEIVARVVSVENVHAWTKAGVMMRVSTNADSAHAFMLVSAGKGIAYQRRTADGGSSTHTMGGAGTAPRWVRLARSGTTITASMSRDGTNWTVVGRDSFPLGAAVLAGLAVSSHDATRLAQATFDNVQVR